MMVLEDPEPTSTHGHTKSTATYGIIPSEKELVEQLLHTKDKKAT